MATKLKSFSRNSVTKLIAFIFIVVLITGGMVRLLSLDEKNLSLEALFIRNYKDSRAFVYNDLSSAEQDVYALIAGGKELSDHLPYYYYVKGEDKTYQNIELDKIKEYDHLYTFEYDNRAYEHTGYMEENTIDTGHTVMIAFPEEYFEERQQDWERSREVLIPYIGSFLLMGAAVFLLIIYLMLVTGRKSGDQELHMSLPDHIYSDVQAFLLFVTAGVSFSAASNHTTVYGPFANRFVIDHIENRIILGTATAVFTIIYGLILLSMTRKLKGHRLLKHTLIYTLWVKLNHFIKSIFDDSWFEHFPLTRSLHRRQLIFISSSAGLVVLTVFFLAVQTPLFILMPILEGVLIYWYLTENKKTYEEINRGFDASLEEQMKSERMKIDLVTNVSHDLKTPLTSIISYVDLLTKEELQETARDYVNILADKSNRLKNIVSDLFDLAKSTSGNMPVAMESLDLKKLMEQTLADMEDKIMNSGMQIKAQLTREPVYIYSDGKKLYRVFQNLIDNALKYSLEGTRIYVVMEEANGFVRIEVKNTAAYEMNFTSEEILQRFNRGDKARTSEGSGLGLSIAESFTKICGGSFMLNIDGDQFKVTVGFRVTAANLS